MTVCVDDHEYLEGVDLDADDFYAMFAAPSHRPVVSHQPTELRAVRRWPTRAAHRGMRPTSCRSIVSAAVSGTLNAARLGARGFAGAGAPGRQRHRQLRRRLLRVGRREAIQRGASLDEAASIAETLAPSIGNVFIVGQLDLCWPAAVAIVVRRRHAEAFRCWPLSDGQVQVIERTSARRPMRSRCWPRTPLDGAPVKVAVGMADASRRQLADSLQCSLGDHPQRARSRALPHRAVGRRAHGPGNDRLLHVSCAARQRTDVHSSSQLRKTYRWCSPACGSSSSIGRGRAPRRRRAPCPRPAAAR